MADKTANVKTVEVTKRPGQGLGLYLREGDGFERVDGVFVSRLLPGSVTEQSGLLQVGDEILTVNSMDVANRRLEDVVIAMSIPKKLVLTVRTQHGTRRPVSETCLALRAEAKPNPVVIIKRGSSVYNDRPRSYCGGGSGRLPRSPERLRVVADSRLLYPRSVSVDFRRLEERSVREEDNFDHLNAVITGDDSGDSGLSSDNSGLSRLTAEPVSEMLQKQQTGSNAMSSPLNVTNSLLILKRTEGLPVARQQQKLVHSRSAWRKSSGWYGPESETDLAYHRSSPRLLVNSRTPSFCNHLQEVPHRKASTPLYQSSLSQGGNGGYQGSNYYTVRRRIQSEAELADSNRGSWYSDCDLPTMSRTHEQANTKLDRIPSGGYKRTEGDLALWLSKLDRVSMQPRSIGKPSDDIPENCELNGSYESKICDQMKRVSMIEMSNRQAVFSRFSSQSHPCVGQDETVPGYKLCHRCQKGNLLLPDEDSASGSNSSESLSPFITHSAPKLNSTTILRRPYCRSNQDLVDKRRRSLSYDPMDFDCQEQRKPLQIRKEAFKIYQSPVRRKQSRDDPGFDGVLLVHVFCGRELVSSRCGSRDMCCVTEFDMVTRAQTAASTGTVNFDWDEEFSVVLQDVRVVSFVLVSWFERVCQLCFHASIELKHLAQKERHQRLCLKMEPSGELYVEFVYTSPQNAFPRVPSVHANAVFGADLETLAKANGVPLVVLRCVEEVERRGLELVGIYCHSGSRRDVRMVRQDLERNTEMADLSERFVGDVNVITSVLKEFLSELPEPLCTSALYDMFFDALVIQVPQDAEGNAQLMLSILDCLPKPYLDTVTYLLNHLRHVLLRSSVNKMTITDLSIALGPLIFCPAEQSLANMKHARNYSFENHSNLLKYLLQIWMAK